MKQSFGNLPSGEPAALYTISCGSLRAAVTDLGAALVSLWVDGVDVVLGCDSAEDYLKNGGFLGAVVGRNANRIRGAAFLLNGKPVRLTPNEGTNSLHSGPDCWNTRLWRLSLLTENTVRLTLSSPNDDQGFPGNAEINVTYTLAQDALTISYDALSDGDTVFNLTNHAYFNLAGEHRPEKAMDQVLRLNASHFLPADRESIPTGEERPVEGTPFDFRGPKPLGQDISMDYEPLRLQSGYDHHFVISGNPCAVLSDPESGRTMTVFTDCPGVQLYTANFLDTTGKKGIRYGRRSGVCLETQFPPDALHHPQWPQPVTRAGAAYHSVTRFQFSSRTTETD